MSSTVPFIARYRQEITGSLDEVAIGAVGDRLKDLRTARCQEGVHHQGP
ncbi:MAG: hypothetical protein MZU95_14545 [Desulfomicrobium escambiense]|nr:hypothetical protein [Desulfomicrobium escambiense]